MSASAQAQLKNESAAGMVITAGNSQTTSISLGQKDAYQLNQNIVKGFADFLTASSKGTESALTWDLGARYERELNERVSLFAGEKVESNKYQNLLQRYSSDVGGKYFFQNTEHWKWDAEFGYRYSMENYPVGYKDFSFLRLYNECVRSFSKATSLKWWIEYLPNITESAAYQLNTEISATAAFNEVFSLSTAYLVKYYHQPPAGTEFKTDSTFTTAIVAKF